MLHAEWDVTNAARRGWNIWLWSIIKATMPALSNKSQAVDLNAQKLTYACQIVQATNLPQQPPQSHSRLSSYSTSLSQKWQKTRPSSCRCPSQCCGGGPTGSTLCQSRGTHSTWLRSQCPTAVDQPSTSTYAASSMPTREKQECRLRQGCQCWRGGGLPSRVISPATCASRHSLGDWSDGLRPETTMEPAWNIVCIYIIHI